jgi:hypothetical protein
LSIMRRARSESPPYFLAATTVSTDLIFPSSGASFARSASIVTRASSDV